MERYIHVDTLIDYIDWDNDIQKWTLRREPEDIPAADVAPVKRGHWIEEYVYTDDPHDRLRYKCSVCGRTEEEKESYCNCGAKIDNI